MNASDEHIKSRRIPLKYIIGFFLVLSLVLVAVAIYLRMGRFDRAVRELEARGEPTSVADLLQAAGDPDSNALTLLKEIQPDLDASMILIEKVNLADFSRISAQEQQLLQPIFDSNTKLTAKLQLASHSESYFSALDKVPSGPDQPSLFVVDSQLLRSSVKYLTLLSRVQELNGQIDQSLISALDAQRMSKLSAQNPTIVSFFVCLAMHHASNQRLAQLIQRTDLTADQRISIEVALAKTDIMQGWIWAVRSERAFSIEQLTSSPPYFAARMFLGDTLLAAFETELGRLSGGNIAIPVAVDDNPFHQQVFFKQLNSRAPEIILQINSLRVLNALRGLNESERARAESDFSVLPLPAEVWRDVDPADLRLLDPTVERDESQPVPTTDLR
jgi:hypothetical protein